jgi:hypothetical protein
MMKRAWLGVALVVAVATFAAGPASWTNPWNQSADFPAWNGWTKLQYVAAVQRTYGLLADNGSYIYSDALFAWNSGAGSWSSAIQGWGGGSQCPASTSTRPGARHPYNTLTVLGRRLYVGPGVCNSSAVTDMYSFDTNASANPSQVWTQLTPVTLPSEYSQAWAADSTHGCLISVRQAGIEGTKTAVYCPTLDNPTPGTLTAAQAQVEGATADDWADVTTNTPPAGSVIPLFVWDSRAGVAILFGGYNNQAPSGEMGETWTYNPVTATWANKSPSHSPGAQSFSVSLAGFAGDIAHGVLYYIKAASPSELWAYSVASNDWTQVSTSGTPPRDPLTAAYDASTNRLVVWGYTAIAFAKVFEAQLPPIGMTGVSFLGSSRMQ